MFSNHSGNFKKFQEILGNVMKFKEFKRHLFTMLHLDIITDLLVLRRTNQLLKSVVEPIVERIVLPGHHSGTARGALDRWVFVEVLEFILVPEVGAPVKSGANLTIVGRISNKTKKSQKNLVVKYTNFEDLSQKYWGFELEENVEFLCYTLGIRFDGTPKGLAFGRLHAKIRPK